MRMEEEIMKKEGLDEVPPSFQCQVQSTQPVMPSAVCLDQLENSQLDIHAPSQQQTQHQPDSEQSVPKCEATDSVQDDTIVKLENVSEALEVDIEDLEQDIKSEEEEATLSDPEYVVTVLTETKPRKKRDKIADRAPNFPCPLCDKVFSYKNSFKHHTKIVHENSFQYCCEECGRKFLNKSSFEVHREIHNPYRKCPECGKVCTSKHNLIHHMRGHTKDYSFKCFCGKGFFTEQKFNLHLRIHTGEKPFECTECDRKFSRKDKLNEHYRRHVGIKLKMCNFCSYRGFDSSDVIKHVKRHHPGTCIKQT